MNPKRVTIIGGATSVKVGAKIFSAGGGSAFGGKHTGAHISVIQTPADDGGSGGAIRKTFNMMAPGDTRRALIALSALKDKKILDWFNHRYTTGPLKGQVIGNLFLAALTQKNGGFEVAIEKAKKIMKVSGDIIPASLRPTTLYARLENGQIIKGETNIDIPKHDGRVRISRVWLKPTVAMNPKAKRALKNADLIMIGPGDLYTSIIPNFLVRGVPAALKKSRAKKIFIVNSISKLGETPNFTASDFIKALETYTGPVLDAVAINTKRPKVNGARLYKPGSRFVEPDLDNIAPRIKVITGNFSRVDRPGFWDPKKLRRILLKFL